MSFDGSDGYDDRYKATAKQRIIAGVLVTVLMLAVVAAVMRMFI